MTEPLPKFKFAEGEKVLCFHGPLIYEAKALRSQVSKDRQIRYFIHYAGWNKNWDEWVPENRVLKFNDANVQRQKEVTIQHNTNLKKAKGVGVKPKKSDGAITHKDSDGRALTPSKDPKDLPKETVANGTITPSRGRTPKLPLAASSAQPSTSFALTTTSATITTATPPTNDDGNRKKRPRESGPVENEEQFMSKVEIKIKIPDDLKSCLVDDWDSINRQHKLVDLPAKTTVDDIMTAYVLARKNAKSSIPVQSKESLDDISCGIIEYFNTLLGSQLLYKFERPQYSDILETNPNKPMVKIYGGIHLLRLFVRLGQMLTCTTIDEKQMHLVLFIVQDLLKFLVKHSTSYFGMNNYVNVTPEYVRRAA